MTKPFPDPRLPNELILFIIPSLPLTSLIRFRRASRQFLQLVEIADICPNRRALLAFYLETVHAPTFTFTRSLALSFLYPFDREAYLTSVSRKCSTTYSQLPSIYKTWILEFPSKAITTPAWPGILYTSPSEPSLSLFTFPKVARALPHVQGYSLGNGTRHQNPNGEFEYPSMLYFVPEFVDLNQEHSVMGIDLDWHFTDRPKDLPRRTPTLLFAGKGVGAELEGQVGLFSDSLYLVPGVDFMDFLRSELHRGALEAHNQLYLARLVDPEPGDALWWRLRHDPVQ